MTAPIPPPSPTETPPIAPLPRRQYSDSGAPPTPPPPPFPSHLLPLLKISQDSSPNSPCDLCLEAPHPRLALCPFLLRLWEYDRELLELQKAGIVPLTVSPLVTRPLRKVPKPGKEKKKATTTQGRKLMKEAAQRARTHSQSLNLRTRLHRPPSPS